MLSFIESAHGSHVGGVNNKKSLHENEFFCQRKTVLLFYSSNMAAAHKPYFGYFCFGIIDNNVQPEVGKYLCI